MGGKKSVVLLLTLAYTLNSADRTLIAILGSALKSDLKLSDAQLGWLIGPAFATLYAFSGLIIARLDERFNRVAIISLALTLWSALTALCGLAANLSQLLLLRMAVGVGEAGCTPPAHSLISDYVDSAHRSTALSIYSCGISLGYILSALAGGYVTMHYGWRTACVVIGLPGALVALLIRAFIKEPPRGRADPKPAFAAIDSTARPRFLTEFLEMVQVARLLFRERSRAHMVFGLILASFAAQGSYAFTPAYFTRAFDLDYTMVGIIAALTGGVTVCLGLAAGGFVTDMLGKRSAAWYALVPALGLMAALPLYIAAFLQADWKLSAALLGAAGFFQYLSFGPTFGVVQNAVDSRRRATATAMIYVLLTVVCLGFGPPFTGWLIDCFSEKSGLALATRTGIILTVLLYAWAAGHYLAGAAGLRARRAA